MRLMRTLPLAAHGLWHASGETHMCCVVGATISAVVSAFSAFCAIYHVRLSVAFAVVRISVMRSSSFIYLGTHHQHRKRLAINILLVF
jgi:hypothetical protein